jgi:hypothetical protein
MATRAELLESVGLWDNPAHLDAQQRESGEWSVFVGYSRGPNRMVDIAGAVRLVAELRKISEHSLADRFEAAADTARRYSLRSGTHEDITSRHKHTVVGRAKPTQRTWPR